MMIRLLHGQTGAPTGEEQDLLQQPTSPIQRSITMVRQLSWLSEGGAYSYPRDL